MGQVMNHDVGFIGRFCSDVDIRLHSQKNSRHLQCTGR